MNDYERCITKSAEQTAQIRTYESIIISGLQHQVDGLRRDQSWVWWIILVLNNILYRFILHFIYPKR